MVMARKSNEEQLRDSLLREIAIARKEAVKKQAIATPDEKPTGVVDVDTQSTASADLPIETGKESESVPENTEEMGIEESGDEGEDEVETEENTGEETEDESDLDIEESEDSGGDEEEAEGEDEGETEEDEEGEDEETEEEEEEEEENLDIEESEDEEESPGEKPAGEKPKDETPAEYKEKKEKEEKEAQAKKEAQEAEDAKKLAEEQAKAQREIRRQLYEAITDPRAYIDKQWKRGRNFANDTVSQALTKEPLTFLFVGLPWFWIQILVGAAFGSDKNRIISPPSWSFMKLDRFLPWWTFVGTVMFFTAVLFVIFMVALFITLKITGEVCFTLFNLPGLQSILKSLTLGVC